jgi:hypothetical protein
VHVIVFSIKYIVLRTKKDFYVGMRYFMYIHNSNLTKI